MKTKNLIVAVCGTILKVAFTVVVVMLIYRGAMLAYEYGYRIFAEEPMTTGTGRTVTVTITEDMGAQEMGELLTAKGLVRDARLFAIQYYVSEYRKDVTAGQYELSTAMTPEEMLEVMATTSGDSGDSQEGSSQIGGSTEENAGETGAGDETAESGGE